jgi:predicted  nucleic acid-binding Zn-ribbon protein
MERNYDEVISDMLIQLAAIEAALEKQNKRMESFDKRMELSIRRMVKAESRLEQHEKSMEVFNTKLEQSIKDQREFSRMQNQMNRYFLNAIKNTKK